MAKPKYANAAIRNTAFDIFDEITTPKCWCGAGAKARHEDGCEPGWQRVDRWLHSPPKWLRQLLGDDRDRIAVVVSLLLDLRTNSQRPSEEAYLVAATQAVHGMQPGKQDKSLVAYADGCLGALRAERVEMPPATTQRGRRLEQWIKRLLRDKETRPVEYDANNGVFLDRLTATPGETDPEEGTTRGKPATKDDDPRDENEPQDEIVDFGGVNTDHSDDSEPYDSIGDGTASSGWDPNPETLERIRLLLLQHTDDPEAQRLCDLINNILHPFASDEKVSAIASADAEVLGHELDRLTDRLLEASGHD